MKPVKIKQIQELPVTMVGDGKNPNLFFVTNRGVVVTITRDFSLAYHHWKRLRDIRPMIESALEDRKWGTICCVEPRDDEKDSQLIIIDDSYQFAKMNPHYEYDL